MNKAQVHAALTVAPVVLPLRTRYRQEMNCQIVKDSIHARPGWTMTYALGVADQMVGFGTVAIAGPWQDKPTILEFYVVPEHRTRAFDLFEAFLEASQARLMEIQSNDLLLAAFAGLALFLSALGIYGVLAYDVSQRTREIGVRSAIGASRGQISGLILRQGLLKGGIGVVLGLIGAALLSRSMTSLLFNVRPTDPAVYAAVSFLLIGVAMLASYLPARRAARIDPLIALRDE